MEHLGKEDDDMPDEFSQKPELIRQAWQLLREGKYLESERVSDALIQQGLTSRAGVPYLESNIMQSLLDGMTGRAKSSISRLLRLMSIYPHDEVLTSIFLSVLRKHVSRLHERSASQQPSGQLVFGLGTGRSGSTTLSYLLGAQESTYASHEHPPILQWNGSSAQFSFHLRRMLLLSRIYRHVADVSHWWLPRICEILGHVPSARFIVVQRDRQKTIDSFLRIKGDDTKGTIHHWITHDGTHFRRNLWDSTYPKFQSQDKAQAIGMYWDAYYAQARQAAAAYPKQVRVVGLSELSDPLKQDEILGFCRFLRPVQIPTLHKNRGSIRDGHGYWPNPLDSVSQS
jgi:hypothetical protein